MATHHALPEPCRTCAHASAGRSARGLLASVSWARVRAIRIALALAASMLDHRVRIEEELTLDALLEDLSLS
jgi:hypothetical protein